MLPCAAVAKSDAFFPESVKLPFESSPAKLPSVAPETLSALSAPSDAARSLTAFGVAAMVSEDELVDDDSCTMPAADVLAGVIAFLVADIAPSDPCATVLMNSVVVSGPVVGLAFVKSLAVTVPPVPVTMPSPAVLPILPSLVMFPCVWELGFISVGKSLTCDFVISMSWNVAATLPSVSVRVASVLPAPNPEMSLTSSVPIAAATAFPLTGLVPAEEYVESTVTVFLVAVISPFSSWDTVSMKDRVFPDAVGETFAVCLVLNVSSRSEYDLPESTRFPLESSPAKLPAVARLTLSAFPVMSWWAVSTVADVPVFSWMVVLSAFAPVPGVTVISDLFAFRSRLSFTSFSEG